MSRRILIIILLFTNTCVAFSQDFEITHLGTEEGLPSNTVYFIKKDSKGFLWFCTDQGIARYNGLYIEKFSVKDGLPDNEIFNCYEDRWGRLWFASYNGELCYFENEKFYNVKNTSWLPNPKKSGLIKYFVPSVKDDGFYVVQNFSIDSILWVGKHSTRIEKVSPRIKDKASIRSYVLFHNGSLSYFVYSDTIQFSKQFFTTRYIVRQTSNYSRLIDSTHYGKNMSERIVISNTKAGLLIVSPRGTYGMANDNVIKSMLKADVYAYKKWGNTYYSGFKNGLIISDGIAKNNYLDKKHVTAIEKSNHENLYIATYNNGVYIFQPIKELKNKRLLFQKARQKSQAQNMQFDLGTYWNGHWYFANKHKVYKLTKNLKLELYADLSKLVIKELISHPSGLYARNVRSLVKLNDNKGHFIRTLRVQDELSDMLIDSIDNVWIVGNTNIYKNQLGSNNNFKVPHLSKLKLKRILISKNVLFGATKTNELIKVHNYDLPSAKVTKLFPGKDITDIKQLNEEYFLGKDEKGENHLFYFDGDRVKAIPIIKDVAKTAWKNIIWGDNKILIKTTSGYYLHELKDIIAKVTDIVLYPKSISIQDEKSYWKKHVSIANNDRHNIVVSYTPQGLFQDDLNYEYAFITKKGDTNWSKTNSPSVTLINTNWGRYTLLFRAYNSQYVYSNTITTTLSISAPFYLRWWFLALLLLSIISLTYFYSLRKSRRENAIKLLEKENEKKFLQSEFKSLNALMNPHFIFNSLNSIQSIINSGDQEAANKYLETFSKMMRQNMKNIQTVQISLEKELNLVENYLRLEKLRFKEKLSYSINIDPQIDISEISVPPLSLQPIVENSVKHGIFPLINKTGIIEISIFEEDNVIIVQVIDNGVGISNSKRKTGNNIALTNTEKRFTQLSKILETEIQFSVEDHVVEGSILGTIAQIKIYD